MMPLTTEITCLALACLLGIVHLFLTGFATTAQLGTAYGISSRDHKKELTGQPGRLNRAYANFTQSFPFFIASVTMTTLANRHGWNTVYGAELYLVARVLYVPCYVFNIVGVRTLCYLAGMVGILMVLSALL